MLRIFGISGFLTIASIVAAGVLLGPGAAVTTTILIAIEIAFSADNAILNAKILERLSRFWQQLFLTVGMLIAIVGMRFVFPILIVVLTANLPWQTVIDEAINHPESYAEHLGEAHASISAFGGAFLMVLALHFLFDHERKELWWKRLERRLQNIGGGNWIPPVLTALMIIIISQIVPHDGGEVIRAGLAGVAAYTIMKLVIDGLGKLAPAGTKIYTGWAAFAAFMYLQLLDASFSFDGVLGAFAVSSQILIIALGLGVGAIWVRSLTVYMVRHGTLNSYKYLEHGAHYAIFILASALLGSLFFEVPDALTGVVGLGVIASSIIASRQALKGRRTKTAKA